MMRYKLNKHSLALHTRQPTPRTSTEVSAEGFEAALGVLGVDSAWIRRCMPVKTCNGYFGWTFMATRQNSSNHIPTGTATILEPIAATRVEDTACQVRADAVPSMDARTAMPSSRTRSTCTVLSDAAATMRSDTRDHLPWHADTAILPTHHVPRHAAGVVVEAVLRNGQRGCGCVPQQQAAVYKRTDAARRGAPVGIQQRRILRAQAQQRAIAVSRVYAHGTSALSHRKLPIGRSGRQLRTQHE